MQMYLRTNERYDFFYIFHLKTELRYLRICFARTIEGAGKCIQKKGGNDGKVNGGRGWLHCFVHGKRISMK